jgi:hypothetical protein
VDPRGVSFHKSGKVEGEVTPRAARLPPPHRATEVGGQVTHQVAGELVILDVERLDRPRCAAEGVLHDEEKGRLGHTVPAAWSSAFEPKLAAVTRSEGSK